MAAPVSTDGVLVGGEPAALLAASSALYEVGARTGDTGRRLAAALSPAATTIAATAPFAPYRFQAVLLALDDVLASPDAGLATVAVAFHAVSLELRGVAQALEVAGAISLLATGGIGLIRGERPTVLASADGVDVRRESMSVGAWGGPTGQNSSVVLREVRRPDGTTFFVVELTTLSKGAVSGGVQVNGAGGYAEVGKGLERTMRWAVPTRRDVELLLAQVSATLVPVAGTLARSQLPKSTEMALARTASAAAVGTLLAVPGTTGSGTATVRGQVTILASGDQRFAASAGGSGRLGLLGAGGTGGSASASVTVDRNRAGAITNVSVITATEVDRGRGGNPLLESGNRESTLVERRWDVELTPERRAAADRIATDLARGRPPSRADVDTLRRAVNDTRFDERTYDARHQQMSADMAIYKVGGGGSAGIDTAVLREPPAPPSPPPAPAPAPSGRLGPCGRP